MPALKGKEAACCTVWWLSCCGQHFCKLGTTSSNSLLADLTSTSLLLCVLPRYALHINESPEPSDVQYENMEHSALARAGRTFITACCSYTALALGFFFISLATASRINVARMAGINLDSCTACRLTVGGVPGLSDADRALYASCDSTGVDPQGGACRDAEKPCYKCYCYTSLTSGRLRYEALPVCGQVDLFAVCLSASFPATR